MNFQFYVLIVMFCLLLPLNVKGADSPSAPASTVSVSVNADSPAASASGTPSLITVEGDVRIHRVGSSDPMPEDFTILTQGEIVSLDQSSRTILIRDLQGVANPLIVSERSAFDTFHQGDRVLVFK